MRRLLNRDQWIGWFAPRYRADHLEEGTTQSRMVRKWENRRGGGRPCRTLICEGGMTEEAVDLCCRMSRVCSALLVGQGTNSRRRRERRRSWQGWAGCCRCRKRVDGSPTSNDASSNGSCIRSRDGSLWMDLAVWHLDSSDKEK